MRSIRHRRSVLASCAFAAVLTAALAGAAPAQDRGADSGRASKNGLAQGKVGGADVKITYGRPKVKGREIWGSLVPDGEVWRAGADEASTITLSKSVKVEGQSVPAGTYGLFFLPEQDQWTVILNKVAKQWGAFKYDATQDLMRAVVKPTMSAESVEELTYEINGDGFVLEWEKVAVPVKVTD